MYSIDDLHNIDDSFKHHRTLTIFWVGFVVYTIGYTMSITSNPIFMICDLMRLIGIVLFIGSSFLMLSYKFENKYLKFFYTVYLTWLLVVVLRGLDLDYEFLKKTLFNPFSGIFLYFAPLILLIPKPPLFYKMVFKVILLLTLFYLIHIGLSFSEMLDHENAGSRDRLEIFVKTLALSSGFILLTYSYQPKINKIIAALSLLLAVFLAVKMARRGLLFITGVVFIFTFLMFIYSNKQQLIYILFSIPVGALIVGMGYSMLYQSDSLLFKKLKDRATEDTRSGVEEFYYVDMELKDWLIGRGMSGLIAAPMGIEEDSKTPGYREGIETDYLNIILKGGILSFGLLLLIAVPAMFKGFFLSKNSFSKAAAFWILLWLLSIYPSTVTTFTMNYLLVWISIGICYSKSIRNMSDEVLKQYFLLTNSEYKKLLQTIKEPTDLTE
ncbi:hypothetical protein MNBD_BACTEROID03-191 [hydrothermal vent metagenome]|uniref:Uncharacterized protein n=1 Tax=hydrothermal vent metagenome TaxID=652676 RepID=A0A3B0TE99_9ZZZZ